VVLTRFRGERHGERKFAAFCSDLQSTGRQRLRRNAPSRQEIGSQVVTAKELTANQAKYPRQDFPERAWRVKRPPSALRTYSLCGNRRLLFQCVFGVCADCLLSDVVVVCGLDSEAWQPSFADCGCTPIHPFVMSAGEGCHAIGWPIGH